VISGRHCFSYHTEQREEKKILKLNIGFCSTWSRRKIVWAYLGVNGFLCSYDSIRWQPYLAFRGSFRGVLLCSLMFLWKHAHLNIGASLFPLNKFHVVVIHLLAVMPVISWASEPVSDIAWLCPHLESRNARKITRIINMVQFSQSNTLLVTSKQIK
jgi:hypothetical protein